MKVRDLNINDYVIVYDLGKSEYSEGMTVVGKFVGKGSRHSVPFFIIRTATGQEYEISNDNYFDLWSNYIESKTESINTTVKWNDNGNLEVKDKYEVKVPDDILNDTSNFIGYIKDEIKTHRSNDVQQRKRNEQNVKPDYYQFEDFEMYEIVEAICKHYNPVVAAWIGQAVQYIGRAPRKNGKEDIAKARDMIERAFEVWDVK